MRKILGSLFKILGSLVAAIFCVALVAGVVFGIRGYNLYQKAVEQEPIQQKVEAICAEEHFTEFSELPERYIDAVISVEDHRFWNHGGIDIIAIGRALWSDLKSFSLAEGGSTITQQVAKNLYFTQEKTLERKFAEVFTAFALESMYSKQEIFELYVNPIYFGSGYYGIYEAAQGYFHKTPKQLSDYESVMLAGLPNAPSAYSPDANPELANQRMEHVLNRMVACNVLTQKQADDLLLAAPEG